MSKMEADISVLTELGPSLSEMCLCASLSL